MLFISTYHSSISAQGLQKVKRLRKRPSKTATNAATSWVPFGEDATKSLDFPVLLDGYNHNMGWVDVADQLKGVFGEKAPVMKGWKCLWRWLFWVTITNCWVLWRLQKKKRAGTHRDFLYQMALRLFKHPERPPRAPPKQVPPPTLSAQVKHVVRGRHKAGKLSKRGYCFMCLQQGRKAPTTGVRKPLAAFWVQGTGGRGLLEAILGASCARNLFVKRKAHLEAVKA